MKVLSMKFCTVSEKGFELANFFSLLGLEKHQRHTEEIEKHDFSGTLFLTGDSKIEVWQETIDMPSGIMLQLTVDDADEFATYAKNNGLEPDGPIDSKTARIYFVRAPNGLQMSFQSTLNSSEADTIDS